MPNERSVSHLRFHCGEKTLHPPDDASFGLDIDGLRRGFYADPPYLNIVSILSALAASQYEFRGGLQSAHSKSEPGAAAYDVGNAFVEWHCVVRRKPYTVIAALPVALRMLRECTGHFDDVGRFVNTSASLEVEAVEDGSIVQHDGFAANALPVLVIRGLYRDFALLKTPILGTLARASRIATNVYRLLDAAEGKPVYTFCARYDPPQVQSIDGYAYYVAVSRYNSDRGTALPIRVSTYANAQWWDGQIEGTISHEAIACFGGDLAELMIRFAEVLPPERLRVALVDFHNDCVADTGRVMSALFKRYRACADIGDTHSANRYRLDGVRIDTSKELVDRSLEDKVGPSDYGPSPKLVKLVRETIDNQWLAWDLPSEWRQRAKRWCEAVKILVSGGFTEDRVREFENQGVPVDAYCVGSALLSGCPEMGTTTDFAGMVMRVKIGDVWCDVPKVGRQRNHNPCLSRVSL